MVELRMRNGYDFLNFSGLLRTRQIRSPNFPWTAQYAWDSRVKTLQRNSGEVAKYRNFLQI